LLAEILHHVVAFELAMDQHVEADLLLPMHCARGFLTKKYVIGRIVDRALAVVGARFPDLRCLWKRADCRRRIRRQIQPIALDFPPDLKCG
jgi:hypothetical protein